MFNNIYGMSCAINIKKLKKKYNTNYDLCLYF